MRRYELSLFNAAGQLLANTSAGFVPSTTGEATFSSTTLAAGGRRFNNPGALNIEFDIPVFGFALPQGNSWIRVSGVGIRTIGQSANLNRNPATGAKPAKFILSAGMGKGLPLANDYVQRGLYGIIAQGQVYNAYGNWQGPEQSLELTLQPAQVDPPNGISFIWAPNQDLADSITDALSVAFPDLKPSVSIVSGLLQTQSSQNVVGWYESLDQFADYILQLTKPLGAALTGSQAYPGVYVTFRGNAVCATDGSSNSKTIVLAFQDLVGQSSWLAPNTISFKCVLRADIQLMDTVQMPPDPGTGGTSIISALALTQQGAGYPGAPARNSSVFKGKFVVTEVHHWGNSRQPDADSWATAFTAVTTA